MAGHESVMLKGGRDGVAIIIDEGADFEVALAELRAKLSDARDFFRGAFFRLDAGRRTLTDAERDAISAIAREFGIQLREAPAPVRGRPLHGDPGKSARWPGLSLAAKGRGEEMAVEGARPTLYQRRTLRSGQRVDFDGNVVIMGDVNAGAMITCTGDIIVLGALRGLAHAGADGDEKAIVMAFRLEPTQLRIAHHISRAPDEAGPRPEGPEIARVKNDMILIEAYVPR